MTYMMTDVDATTYNCLACGEVDVLGPILPHRMPTGREPGVLAASGAKVGGQPQRCRPSTRDGAARQTLREQAVGAAQIGLSRREIAKEMGVSPQLVRRLLEEAS